MAADSRNPGRFRRRTLFLIFGLLLFMPPLALFFQVSSGDGSFCGTWCPRMFFVWREKTTLASYLFGWLRSWGGVLLLLAILFVTLLFGRLWCSHLCPVGGSLELGNRLVGRKFSLPFSSIPAAPVRYGYFAVYLLAPLIGLGSLCCSYCNFAAVPRVFGAALDSPADIAYFLRSAGLINLTLLLLLGVFARGGRAYCNFFCPIGAIDGIMSRLTARFGKRMQIDSNACSDCGKCVEVCPTWAISEEDESFRIDQLSCLPCGKCEQVCEDGAIDYARQVQGDPPHFNPLKKRSGNVVT